MFSVQYGKGEMAREDCGADEAIQNAYPMTQMEAFKPCQRRPGNVLDAMEALSDTGPKGSLWMEDNDLHLPRGSPDGGMVSSRRWCFDTVPVSFTAITLETPSAQM